MSNNIKILLGLLIVLAGMAYYLIQTDNSKSANELQFLLPSWQNNPAAIEAVTEVQLTQGETTIDIKKINGNWLLNDGFYVNLTPLSELLQSLLAAEIVEKKTANPANFEQLALTDRDLNVAIYQGDTLINHIHIGINNNAGLVFIRHAAENQSYLVKNLKPVSISLASWQLKTVLDITASEVVAIDFQPIDGEAFKIQRNSMDLSLEVTDIPIGFQSKPEAHLNTLFNGLSRLLVDEAMPLDLTDKALKQTIIYQLTDNSELTIKLFQQSDNYYMTIDSENYAHYEGWMMTLAAYKFDALNKQASDVIEPASTADVVEANEPVVE